MKKATKKNLLIVSGGLINSVLIDRVGLAECMMNDNTEVPLIEKPRVNPRNANWGFMIDNTGGLKLNKGKTLYLNGSVWMRTMRQRVGL